MVVNEIGTSGGRLSLLPARRQVAELRVVWRCAVPGDPRVVPSNKNIDFLFTNNPVTELQGSSYRNVSNQNPYPTLEQSEVNASR